MFESFFSWWGRPFLSFYNSLSGFGKFIIFQFSLIPLYFSFPLRIKEIFQQIEIIGVGSFGVIFLTAFFTGMVEAVQLYQGFKQFGAENFMGFTIFVSISKELAPVFGALMLTSRAISSMSAELGTMRVTEQIDAIDTLSINSKKYLIIPRIIATTISLPILIIIFDLVANSSAYLVSVYALNVNPTLYQSIINQYLHLSDILTGVIKGFIFGFLISSIGTYVGYFVNGGAKGVGIATTEAVVYSAVTIFITNYFISAFFLLIQY